MIDIIMTRERHWLSVPVSPSVARNGDDSVLVHVRGPDQKLPMPKKHSLFALFSSLWFMVSLWL